MSDVDGTGVTPALSDAEVLDAFPSLAIDQDNVRHFRGRLERRLLVNRCGDCGTWHEPPRAVCPACWSTQVEPTEVSGRGSIALLTVLHHGPPVPGVDYEAGYPVAAVELIEQAGLRFTATITPREGNAPQIGDRVELSWSERGGAPVPTFRVSER